MAVRLRWSAAALSTLFAPWLLLAAVGWAQTPRRAAREAEDHEAEGRDVADGEAEAAAHQTDPTRWRTRAQQVADDDEETPVRAAAETKTEAADSPAPRAGRRSRGGSSHGSLPSGDGQTWQEYDIGAYTSRVANVERPEQTVIDWVLRETGYEAWHREPAGVLWANGQTLSVYHTAEIQDVAADMAQRFTNVENLSVGFGLRVITIDNPNWRARAQRVLTPVSVETQGVQAWLVENEDAALLLAELRKRTDYREHSSPNLLVMNGQSEVVAATRARSYVKDVNLRGAAWPGYETEMGTIDEGFSLELSPLLSADGATIDAVLKCHIDQLERLRPVVVEVPTPAAPRQRTKIEVPQVSHCRVHERFRWPAGKSLLIGLGVVATPTPVDPGPLRLQLPVVPPEPPRADLLVLIEDRGKVTPPQTAAEPEAAREARAPTFRGRY